jgi:hypothetical protein
MAEKSTARYCLILRSLRPIITILLSVLFYCSFSQKLIVKGIVADKSKINAVKGVTVTSTSGKKTITDSLGRYSIEANLKDSLFFTYKNKPTEMFPVKKITNTDEFNISILINVEGAIKTLQEVVVISKSYKQDSIENRERYARFFEPTQSEGLRMYDGTAGIDMQSIYSIFQVKKRRREKQFRNYLIMKEEEKYIDNRFSRKYVQRLTKLTSPHLDTFMVWYRPTYTFLASLGEIDLNYYIIKANTYYRNMFGLKPEEQPTIGNTAP